MFNSVGSRDFDTFRDDFVFYLADRLGVSQEAARSYLGDWLVAFSGRDQPATLESAANAAALARDDEVESRAPMHDDAKQDQE